MQHETSLPKLTVWRPSGLSVAVLLTLLTCCTLLGCPSEQQTLPPTGELSPLLPQRLYEIFDVTRAGSVQSTPDGGFLLVGTGSYEGEVAALCTSRLSPSGEVMWARIFDGLYAAGSQDQIAVGTVTPEGGSAVAGITRQNDYNGYLHVLLTDANGETVWEYVHDKRGHLPQAIVRADDGGYVVAGAYNYLSEDHKGFLLKVSADGAALWKSTFERTLVFDMKRTPDGGFVLAGSSRAPENVEQYGFEMAVLRTDPEGNGVWFRRYQEEGDEKAYAVDVLPDGGLVLAGRKLSGYVKSPIVLRTDPDGNELWRRADIRDVDAGDAYEVSYEAGEVSYQAYEVWDMVVAPSGKIVLVAESDRINYIPDFLLSAEHKASLFQLDGLGNMQWEAKLPSFHVRGVCTTSRGTYMTVGSTGTAIQLIEVDTNGNILN